MCHRHAGRPGSAPGTTLAKLLHGSPPTRNASPASSQATNDHQMQIPLAHLLGAAHDLLSSASLLVRAELERRSNPGANGTSPALGDAHYLGLAEFALCRLGSELGRLETVIALERARDGASLKRPLLVEAIDTVEILNRGCHALWLALERLQATDQELLVSSQPVLNDLMARLLTR